MDGAWKIADMEACNLPELVATGFAEAFEDFAGASYVPVLYCGEQLVSGTNYMILCKQTLAIQEPVDHLATVIIHKPLPNAEDSSWKIVSIDTIV